MTRRTRPSASTEGATRCIGAASILCLLFALTASATPTAPAVLVGAVSGSAGQIVSVPITLQAAGQLIAGVQNDLTPDAQGLQLVSTPAGGVDCSVNADIHKSATLFEGLPSGCSGSACGEIRALVFDVGNLDAIADGALLYRCNLRIRPDALPGAYAIIVSNVGFSDPFGRLIAGTGVAGQITVVPPPTSTATALATPTPSPSAGPQAAIVASSANGRPGDTVSVAVHLRTAGASIAGAQNDISFDPLNAPILAGAGGQPDCTVNASIAKEATSFAFEPHGCVGQQCSSVRAVVFSTENSAAIPDGATLYTCTVAISTGAETGQYALDISNVHLADVNGRSVPGLGIDAIIDVQPAEAAVSAADVTGDPGEQLAVPITLTAEGLSVAGIQNELAFDAVNAPIAARGDGSPDCTVNPAINKDATTFSFAPYGCQGTACAAVRALVFSITNVNTIADGALLYTCHVAIAPSAALSTYPLQLAGVLASDPGGESLPTAAHSGSVTVVAMPAAIIVGTVQTMPGAATAVAVSLASHGKSIAAAQVDIGVDPSAPIAATAGGAPDCAVNPAIGKNATTFMFEPNGCDPDSNCDRIRAVVIAFDNATPIPDAPLFTCGAAAAGDAAVGTYTLTCLAPEASDPAGNPAAVTCSDGAVVVQPACPGDCNNDGQVTIAELLTAVDIDLGSKPLAACPAAGLSVDHQLSVSDLVRAVDAALLGCPTT